MIWKGSVMKSPYDCNKNTIIISLLCNILERIYKKLTIYDITLIYTQLVNCSTNIYHQPSQKCKLMQCYDDDCLKTAFKTTKKIIIITPQLDSQAS